jgi:Ca-activated chloride channel family protein
MNAVAVVISLIVAGVVTIVAQSTGQIAGTVRDSSGAVMPGVRVEVTSPALIEKVRSTTTDKDGQYRITGLPAGIYTVRFSLDGFATHQRSGVEVMSTFTAPVNATMSVGGLQETVAVAAEAPAGDVQSARQAARIVPGIPGGVPGGVVGGVPGSVAPSAPVAAPPPGYGRGAGTGGGVYACRGVGTPCNPGVQPYSAESYDSAEENGIRRVDEHPLSTFSIDVDTASYANVRRFLTEGSLPPADAVRIEELINYFTFDYPQPRGPEPFSITTELAESPWNPRYRLALIGIKGRDVDDDHPKARNLVFLLDVSGSMATPDKLPLVRDAMRMLVDELTPQDRVAIVTYAGYSGVALPSTPGNRKDVIHRAISRLEANGSTNGGAGIQLAYQQARENFIRGGINRVILTTDGDFNVGVTSQDALVRLIETERESGVFLSVLGVGTGNLKDSTMEKLADKGNGNYSYLDSLQEARRVLVRQASSTLETIAKDVKIQIEFNPRAVSAYRLIGYDNRMLRNRDFNDDRKDAGEIGAGHTVTALYEVVPVGVAVHGPGVDALRYQQTSRSPGRPATPAAGDASELAFVKVRYKAPREDTSRLVEAIVRNRVTPSTHIGFASAVAEFGMLLRNSDYRGNANFAAVLERARAFRGRDDDGYRAEFVRLVDLAAGLYRLRAPEREFSSR